MEDVKGKVSRKSVYFTKRQTEPTGTSPLAASESLYDFVEETWSARPDLDGLLYSDPCIYLTKLQIPLISRIIRIYRQYKHDGRAR